MIKANGIDRSEFLEYKGRPLVRHENEIYYGDIKKAHVKMMIMSEKTAEKTDKEIPDLIILQLFEEGEAFPKRQNKAFGLSDALETAAFWLDGYDK